jgi:DNA (cytosine-5)-methyltransferase 1
VGAVTLGPGGPLIGSLFSGYGGLDSAVKAVFGGHTAWVADIEPGPKAVLAYRFPDAPNLGDVTRVDWGMVARVDVLCGGSPCQSVSVAGARAGMVEGAKSNLWVAMREAIAQLQPSLVVWENVYGVLSAKADSSVECCTGCVGDGSTVSLRALGRVLGDLASLGYDAAWTTVSAAEIGAPHKRTRLFLIAWVAADTNIESGGEWWQSAALETQAGWAFGEFEGRDRTPSLLPTPTTARRSRNTNHGAMTPTLLGIDSLLPTPRATDAGNSMTAPSAMAHVERGFGTLPEVLGRVLLPTPVAQPSANTAENHLAKKPGRRMVTDLAILAGEGFQQRALLPTPKASDGEFGLPRTSGRPPEKATFLATRLAHTDFGVYREAVELWSSLFRPAPPPTVPSKRGKPQLNPRFCEWMMGLPDGWVTGVPKLGRKTPEHPRGGATRMQVQALLSRAAALRMLGNGVVPQQAELALRRLVAQTTGVTHSPCCTLDAG